MSEEPLGAVTPDEMDELSRQTQPHLEPPRGDTFYYVIGDEPGTSIRHAPQTKLAFVPRLYYFRNYFHAYAFWCRVRDKKVKAYRDLDYIPIESYPISAPKPKRR